MKLSEQIQADMKTAMRNKEQAKLRALRAVKSAMLLASTEKNASQEQDDDAIVKIIQKLVKQRKESLTVYEDQKREDLAQEEREELELLESYLPEQMSEEAIEAAVKSIIDRTGASGKSDMGRVMGMAMKELAGKADGKIISQKAAQLLGS